MQLFIRKPNGRYRPVTTDELVIEARNDLLAMGATDEFVFAGLPLATVADMKRKIVLEVEQPKTNSPYVGPLKVGVRDNPPTVLTGFGTLVRRKTIELRSDGVVVENVTDVKT